MSHGFVFVFRLAHDRGYRRGPVRKWGWTHNGIVPSVLIAFGAVLALFFIRALFGLSLGSPGIDAIFGSAAALILIPTEYANRRRQKNRRR